MQVRPQILYPYLSHLYLVIVHMFKHWLLPLSISSRSVESVHWRRKKTKRRVGVEGDRTLDLSHFPFKDAKRAPYHWATTPGRYVPLCINRIGVANSMTYSKIHTISDLLSKTWKVDLTYLLTHVCANILTNSFCHSSLLKDILIDFFDLSPSI